MRRWILILLVACAAASSASAQLSVGVAVPGVSIGIHVPVYPELVPVPGYPVYYAPRLGANFFFYDGLYWVYQGDRWYVSSWYDGPWRLVSPYQVPSYVLLVPVRYYRVPPPYFSGWRADAPPRWGDHWGDDWRRQRAGWDRRDRIAAVPVAPLPRYQRQYSGDRYPQEIERQQAIRDRNYPYRPQDARPQPAPPTAQPSPQGGPPRGRPPAHAQAKGHDKGAEQGPGGRPQ